MNKQVSYRIGDSIATTLRSWKIERIGDKKTPAIKCTFENYIDWTGWFTPDAMAVTMKALQAMGYKYPDLKSITKPDAFDLEKEVLCEIEESREYKGKKYYKAKWVNSIFRKGFNEKNLDTSLIDELGRMDVRAYTEGATSPQDSKPGNDFDPGPTDSDIPAQWR